MRQRLVDIQNTLVATTQDLSQITTGLTGCIRLLESVIKEGPAAQGTDLRDVAYLQQLERGLGLLRETVSNHSRVLSDMTRPKRGAKKRAAKKGRAKP